MLWLSPYRSQHQDPWTPVGISGTTASLARYVARFKCVFMSIKWKTA